MEVEYVACYLATKEAIWLNSFLQDLKLTPRVYNPKELMSDNNAAIQFAKDLKFHTKTKHIKRLHHFVRDAIKEKEVVIQYISTSTMLADPSLNIFLERLSKLM